VGVKFLAFEAATTRLSVALWCDGVIAEKSALVPNGGSERLLPWANELLAEAGISLKQLDGIAFGAGPGGFTGLRLACGVAQGLACGLDLPVAPVGTLAALALAGGEGKALACLDARMNEIYLAAYLVIGEGVQEIMPSKVGAGATAPLPEGDGWCGVGDGFATPHGLALQQRMGERLGGFATPHGLALQQRMGERLGVVDAAAFPTATAVARLAAQVLARGEGVGAERALPLYVRDKVALTTAERLARGGVK